MNPSAVKNDMNNTKEDVRSAKGDLRDAANNLGRKVRGVVDSASDELSGVTDTLTSHIKENPLQSALIALGAGVVLSLLLRRR